MDNSPPDDILAWEDLIYIADLLEVSQQRRVSLLGGEPFLHPNSVEFALYLLERGLNVSIFTSGLLSPIRLKEAERDLGSYGPERLAIVCNINDPSICSPAELAGVRRFLSSFGRVISAGFNLFRPDFELDFLFQLINEFGLKRDLRLGLAHPIPGDTYNAYVGVNDLSVVADRLVSYIPKFESFGVTPHFDCGMPMCLFSDAQLGQLYKVTNGHLDFHCSPAFDIGPDMTVWSCFAMSCYRRRSLYEFNSMDEANDFYLEMHRAMRIEAAGVFEKCDVCRHREAGLCSGGCLAHNLTHFMNEPRVRLAKVYADE